MLEECLTNILASICDTEQQENIYSLPEETNIDDELLLVIRGFRETKQYFREKYSARGYTISGGVYSL